MATNQTIMYEKRGQITYITLNRPDSMNAMNSTMVRELNRAWMDFNQDSDARVAIVTAVGKAFCAGIDIKELASGWDGDTSIAQPGLGIDVPKPVIGAINGYTFGAGLILAMQCDIRIASETSQFGYPESKIGSSAGVGADITKYMPLGVAVEILFTGQPIDAKRAYEVGFVNRVTTEEELMAEASKMAQVISDNAPLVLKLLKRLAYHHTYSVHREEQVLWGQLFKPQFESEDRREGERAFKEKRKPQFKGK